MTRGTWYLVLRRAANGPGGAARAGHGAASGPRGRAGQQRLLEFVAAARPVALRVDHAVLRGAARTRAVVEGVHLVADDDHEVATAAILRVHYDGRLLAYGCLHPLRQLLVLAGAPGLLDLRPDEPGVEEGVLHREAAVQLQLLAEPQHLVEGQVPELLVLLHHGRRGHADLPGQAAALEARAVRDEPQQLLRPGVGGLRQAAAPIEVLALAADPAPRAGRPLGVPGLRVRDVGAGGAGELLVEVVAHRHDAGPLVDVRDLRGGETEGPVDREKLRSLATLDLARGVDLLEAQALAARRRRAAAGQPRRQQRQQRRQRR
mmetsp:Transcript_16891/g.51064  ORF Transcript_16891/g.51064 Transcript_16891/m.51064 type:complete len:319 (-) Transcript_16891:204-1160(-)